MSLRAILEKKFRATALKLLGLSLNYLCLIPITREVCCTFWYEGLFRNTPVKKRVRNLISREITMMKPLSHLLYQFHYSKSMIYKIYGEPEESWRRVSHK